MSALTFYNVNSPLPGGCTWNDFYTSCLSPFSLRKGLNITVNLGPRISKKGLFLKNFQIFWKKKIVFLNDDENNSSHNLYQHSDKKKHSLVVSSRFFKNIECTRCKNAIAYSSLYKLCEL